MPETSLTEINWKILLDRSTTVPFEALQQEVEKVRQNPALLEEFYARWDEVDASAGTIETYERAYIPYILTKAGEGLPEGKRAEMHEMLLAYLSEAGFVDDEAQCEFLMRCCQSIGPPILPALLEVMESEDFSPVTGDWYYHWGVAEVALKADEAMRWRMGDLCVRLIRKAMEKNLDDLAATEMAAELLANLHREDAIPLLEETGIKLRAGPSQSYRISAREMDFAIKALRGKKELDRPLEVDLDEALRHEVEAYDEWYNTRGPDWQAEEEEEDIGVTFAEDGEDEFGADEYDEEDELGGGLGGVDLSAIEALLGADVPPAEAPVRAGPKIGRNEPCPCGSGKKYKKCCGK